MKSNGLLKAYELTNEHLVGLEVNEVLNSIGSNVFFYFGNDEETVHPNGRQNIGKEWRIWISNSSWRLTQNGLYLVGSGDNRKDIAFYIQKLLGKHFQSLQFLSSFLDVEFNFDDGYQLTTFFNWFGDDQWTIFLPKKYQLDAIGTDCSGHEEIKQVQGISKEFLISKKYSKVDYLLPDVVVTALSFDQYERPTVHFGSSDSIRFENCMWRFEKNGEYVFGCLDQDDLDFKAELSKLIGNKLIQVDIANSMMDGIFKFENGYILKTFTCSHSSPQWQISSKSVPTFEANIRYLENDKT